MCAPPGMYTLDFYEGGGLPNSSDWDDHKGINLDVDFLKSRMNLRIVDFGMEDFSQEILQGLAKATPYVGGVLNLLVGKLFKWMNKDEDDVVTTEFLEGVVRGLKLSITGAVLDHERSTYKAGWKSVHDSFVTYCELEGRREKSIELKQIIGHLRSMWNLLTSSDYRYQLIKPSHFVATIHLLFLVEKVNKGEELFESKIDFPIWKKELDEAADEATKYFRDVGDTYKSWRMLKFGPREYSHSVEQTKQRYIHEPGDRNRLEVPLEWFFHWDGEVYDSLTGKTVRASAGNLTKVHKWTNEEARIRPELEGKITDIVNRDYATIKDMVESDFPGYMAPPKPPPRICYAPGRMGPFVRTVPCNDLSWSFQQP